VAWAWRRAARFHDVITWTGDGTANRQISHALTISPGMVITKSTSAVGDWNVYHASAAGDLRLNTTAAQTASHAIVTGASAATFTVAGVANTAGVSYVAYLFGDVSGTAMAGGYSGAASDVTVSCGFTPRFVLLKQLNSAVGWGLFDTARGINAGTDALLLANSAAAEQTAGNYINPTAGGFVALAAGSFGGAGNSFVFYAVA
jgi:hypothetical protein